MWDALERHSRDSPSRVAVLGEGAHLTYRELADRVRIYIRSMRSRGVSRRDLIAVTIEEGPDAIAALLAGFVSGIVFVWMDTAQPEPRRQLLLDDCRPRGMLTTSGGDLRIDWFDSMGAGTPLPDDTACLVYTSGSTGIPKGIVQFRDNLEQFCAWFADEVRLGASSRMLQLANMTYDAAYAEILTGILAGASLIAPDANVKRDVASVSDLMDRTDPTHMILVPSVCRYLLQVRAGRRSSPRRAVEVVGLFGETLPPDLLGGVRKHFPDARVYNLYGPTEATLATFYRVPHDFADHVVPIGWPIPGREVMLHSDSAEADADTGEIWIRSRYLAHGYVNRDQETRERFLPDPSGVPGVRIYRTGDIGRRLADQSLVFVGRLDDEVKIRGVRIQLGEVEATVRSAPGVTHASVRFFPEHEGGPRLAAYLQPLPASKVDVRTAHRYVADRLPPAMVPSAYVVLDELPLTSTGKVDRSKLPNPWDVPDRQPGSEADAKGLDPTALELGRIWRDVIGCPDVTVDDDFFAVGGTSLLAPQVIAGVQASFGVRLPLQAVFQQSRLGDFAELIESNRS
ncbi:non-ribosomal peptide synthetase [Dactylosporangium sp. NPDC050588]|uniref:non-ribosomal peptide synthetase n=1 Tax=Dactylosporangium sp. NPDC050588 TaxID=3157211 RepID=UPI0033CBEA4B